ncbi:ABC transporter substrate-binding protein [Cumulibacter soli]|uniref:ABC transporter substrate-binding protein n=1 Tax=Cumulibacter soli TaxID=2546344 RepID=UPI001419FB4F|nr:ABC transporter substrate-binding protein [Cumulibacter soli]
MKFPVRPASAVLALTLLTSGCGSAPEKSTSQAVTDFPNSIDVQEGWDPEAHFDWAYASFVGSWDPMLSSTGGDIVWYSQIYDTLLNLTLEGTPEPRLVTEWEAAEDNKSVIFTLRDSVKFSDGTPFDADAVKFNLERYLSEDSLISSEIAQITSIDVIDSAHVKITVSSGLGALLSALTARAGMMVSPTAAKAGNLGGTPVGSGAYTITKILPGDRVEIEKTDDYWDPDAQRVATMTLHYMVDDQARLNALKSGELDGAVLTPDQIDSADAADLQVVAEPSTAFIYFMVNTGQEPFDDVRVRKALNHAVDREGIANGLYQGHCTPSVQPWPSSSIGYSETVGDGLDVYNYNPQKAKDLLAEAGVKDLKMTSVSVNIPTYVKVAEVVQENLKDVGIDLTVTQVPAPEVIDDFVTNQTAQANINPYSGFSDPHGVIARNFMPESLFNIGEPMPQEMLDLAISAADPVDPADRTPLYDEFMQQWMENPPYLMSICLQHSAAAYGPGVSGVSQDLSGWANYRGVAVAE